MKRLKIKINFECTHANKKETEMELEKIIHYHIYEKIWNIDPKGVKLDVKENLIRESANRCLIRTHNSALDSLMAVTECEIPKVMIEQESQRLAESTKAELKSKGMNTDNKDLPADLFRARAERRVKLGLVVGEIIQKEKLEPTAEEIALVVDEMSGVYEDPTAFKKWFLEIWKEKDKTLENIRIITTGVEAVEHWNIEQNNMHQHCCFHVIIR